MASVKDKTNAIKKEVATVKAGAKQIYDGRKPILEKISKQKEENRAAIKAIDTGAKAVEDKIKKQTQTNVAAAKEIDKAVTGLVGDIKGTIQNVKDYINVFYFGKGGEKE